MKSANLSADHRPIAKTQKLSADGKKKYNKVVIILFLSADENRAKIWHLSADKSADHRPINPPTVGGVNVIAVYAEITLKNTVGR